jgi:ketosteroid isomerase-like protein
MHESRGVGGWATNAPEKVPAGPGPCYRFCRIRTHPAMAWSSSPMADSQHHLAALRELNGNFVRAVDKADVAWFDANLATDFYNTNPDGSFVDRAAFLAQIGRGSSVKDIREHDVVIRILGDFAIIHARTSYQKPDGTQGAGRYTDDWSWRDGRWQCVSAHVTRL